MPPGIPSNAPHWVYGIYWFVIAIGAAFVVIVPLGIKAYSLVHDDLVKMRESNKSIQASSSAAAINSAIVSRKVDSLSPNPVALPDINPVVPTDTTEQDILAAASLIKKEISSGKSS